MFEFEPKITKEWIKERVSEEEIFSYYLGIQVELNYLFKSPMREDHNPTCSFYISPSGVLRMTDFSGYFSGDCFNLVEFLYGVSFYEALRIIAIDFNLLKESINKKQKSSYIKREIKDKPKIEVTIRNWSNSDREYWEKYGINEKLLKFFNVVPVRNIYINNEIKYGYNKYNPAYGYLFNQNEIKIYFPKAKKNIQPKFIGNAIVLQGYLQLPKEGKYLVITKSLKDVMVLYNFGIPAVAPQSESQILNDEQYGELSERFDYIFSLYDFDKTGIISANKMKKMYGITPFFFTNTKFPKSNTYFKDISDAFAHMGSRRLFESIRERIKRYFENKKNKKVL